MPCGLSKVEPVPVVTVTVAVPPSSAMVAGSTSSASTGAVSSSRIVSVASAGADTPVDDTVPDTDTWRSGVSVVLSTAAIVTEPVPTVAPAAKLRVVPDCWKSPASAGDTGAAVTSTVNAVADAGDTVAVTVLVPPSSAIDGGVSTSVTAGIPSSSAIVTVCSVPNGAPSREAPITMVSASSSTASSTAVSVAVTLEALAPEPGGSVSAREVMR